MSDTEPLPATQPLSPPEKPKVDEIAELRKDVEMLKAHLAALEALVLKITERMGGETRQ